jgi:glycine/D-amino acid oxidase-like deaminating enzyme
LSEPATIDEIIAEEYDLLVLGSGEGAKFVAWTLAKEGQRVAVVERKWIGGSCPNIACLPSGTTNLGGSFNAGKRPRFWNAPALRLPTQRPWYLPRVRDCRSTGVISCANM